MESGTDKTSEKRIRVVFLGEDLTIPNGLQNNPLLLLMLATIEQFEEMNNSGEVFLKRLTTNYGINVAIKTPIIEAIKAYKDKQSKDES